MRQYLKYERQRDGRRFPGQVEEQAIDGKGVEPVSVLADNLGNPEPAEIGITSDQAKVVREADARGCHAKPSASQKVGVRP